MKGRPGPRCCSWNSVSLGLALRNMTESVLPTNESKRRCNALFLWNIFILFEQTKMLCSDCPPINIVFCRIGYTSLSQQDIVLHGATGAADRVKVEFKKPSNNLTLGPHHTCNTSITLIQKEYSQSLAQYHLRNLQVYTAR